MVATVDLKIEAMAVLREMGKWDEATKYREAKRRELRDAGVSRREAKQQSWRAMIGEFLPGPREHWKDWDLPV